MIPGSRGKHPNYRRSLLFAVQGFRNAVRQEANLKRMLAIAGLVLVVSLVVGLDIIGWILVIGCIGSVISAELLNTAIETVVDLVSPEFHPLAGRAKDIAAAASWFISGIAALIGILVFARALFHL